MPIDAKDFLYMELLSGPSRKAIDLIRIQADTCYNSSFPDTKNPKKIDVFGKLVKTGHVSTLESVYYTVLSRGTSVNNCTRCLHGAHGWYSSGQQSGRYSTMYDNPDFDRIISYLKALYPGSDNHQAPTSKTLRHVTRFLNHGHEFYRSNIGTASEIALKLLKKQRPNAPVVELEKAAPKIAQEQLRMVFSTIFPTNITHTINLLTLAILFRFACTPEQRVFVNMMVEHVLARDPELEFLFQEEFKADDSTLWTPEMKQQSTDALPDIFLESNDLSAIQDIKDSKPRGYLHGHFHHPAYSGEKVKERIRYSSIMSMETLGQEQRHRTTDIELEYFSPEMFIPPLIEELGTRAISDVHNVYEQYLGLRNLCPHDMFLSLAPYGQKVKVKLASTPLALVAKLKKRNCFLAGAPISNNSRKLQALLRTAGMGEKALTKALPDCFLGGKCPEGARCCGRKKSMSAEEFLKEQRKV